MTTIYNTAARHGTHHSHVRQGDNCVGDRGANVGAHNHRYRVVHREFARGDQADREGGGRRRRLEDDRHEHADHEAYDGERNALLRRPGALSIIVENGENHACHGCMIYGAVQQILLNMERNLYYGSVFTRPSTRTQVKGVPAIGWSINEKIEPDTGPEITLKLVDKSERPTRKM